MTEATRVTRTQLRSAGADEDWFREHMVGRGRLPLSKVVTCAPVHFEVTAHDRAFTGAVCYANGDREWYLNGQRHREDGPAVEYADGDRLWYLNGQRHREDGPAEEYADGTREWHLNGTEYANEDQWKKALR